MNNQIENKDCTYCLKRMNILLKDFKESSDESSKYTSFVFSIGYVTMITIFSTIHKYLAIQPKAVFVCLLFVSIILFLINEIWRMYMSIYLHAHKSNLWKQNLDGKINLDQLEYEANKYGLKLFEPYEKFYFPSFWISLICGILAAIVLFLECLYLIF